MIRTILIDMDDTLIFNQAIYEEARATLRGYLAAFGVAGAEVDKALTEIDALNHATMGYSKARYPLSFEQTVQYFIPDADAEMLTTAHGFATAVFSTIAALKPGTLEAIDLLTAQAPVYIVTQGDREVQETRVSHLPFKDKLAGVIIVDKKTPEVFSGLVATLNIKPAETVMIGDSLKSDILTAAAAGLHAAWVESHNAPFEKSADALPASAHKFASLLEVAKHLDQHGDITAPAPRPADKNWQPWINRAG